MADSVPLSATVSRKDSLRIASITIVLSAFLITVAWNPVPAPPTVADLQQAWGSWFQSALQRSVCFAEQRSPPRSIPVILQQLITQCNVTTPAATCETHLEFAVEAYDRCRALPASQLFGDCYSKSGSECLTHYGDHCSAQKDYMLSCFPEQVLAHLRKSLTDFDTRWHDADALMAG